MTGARTSLIRDIDHRAEGDAALAVALVALAFVPLPALLAIASHSLEHFGMATTVRTLEALIVATPLFALFPFVMGCGIGTLLHLALTAPARFAIIRADRHARVGARSLVAMSLVVGGTFAAIGLLAGVSLF